MKASVPYRFCGYAPSVRSGAEVLVASNRGPVAFRLGEDGRLHLARGAGGLVSGVSAVAAHASAVWVCAALSEADRMAATAAPSGRLDEAGHDTGGAAVRMLPIEDRTFRRAYNAVANSTLWYVNHTLFDTPRTPVFDSRWARNWQAYVDYNTAFAEALAEEAKQGAKVLVQDYHLLLAPALLRQRRPDLRIGHFTHTPWAEPSYFSLLPDDVTGQLLTGMLGADSLGFLSPRWAEAFVRCCVRLLGADAGGTSVHHNGRSTRIAVHALGVDADELRERAAQPDVLARREVLQRRVGNAQVMVRVDRTELSKNIVRGLASYRELLRSHPEHRGRVVHIVFAYPSRHDLPDYRAYTAEVQRVAREIDDEFATADWSPIVLEVNDDYARSLAALQIADVLIVNPLRDGMNLVAKEGPVLSERGMSVVLSREAGAADEFAADALLVNPYDVTGTAARMHEALCMTSEERRAHTEALAKAAAALPPSAWLAAQLAAL